VSSAIKNNNRFTIVLKNGRETLEVDYTLHDTLLAQKWFSKLKHLRKVPFDKVESELTDVADLDSIYKQFCEVAGIKHEAFKDLDQEVFNRLHKMVEDHHERLSKTQESGILYKLHHSIHFNEERGKKNTKSNINVSWGVNEGPLTHQFNCGDYYERHMIKNNLYLPWAELGKTPMTYWRNSEPNNQIRFNSLAKPHTTFRAKFCIAADDCVPNKLDVRFVEWFERYKQGWLQHHGLKKWDEVDEFSAPLLATTDSKYDIQGFVVEKIVL
jgi:hypothetical protein